MNKRGENEAPSTFGGATLEILVIILMVFIAYSFIKAALFPSGEQISLKNFEGLVEQINLLLSHKEPFASRDSYALSLEDQYTLVGFNKNQDVYETCGDPLEKISKPEICGSKACLCLYMDDTDAGHWYNTNFNEALQKGEQKLIECKQIDADNIFSHPYGLIKTEEEAYLHDSYLRINYNQITSRENIDIGIPAGPSDEDKLYYSLGNKFTDFTRNFRGYPWEGPYATTFGDVGFLETKNNKVAQTILPMRRGGSSTEGISSSDLKYYDRRIRYYEWCESKNLLTKASCLQELEKLKKADENQYYLLEKPTIRYLTGAYSSFVLYGECQGNDPKLNDGQWNTGSLYLEKFKDPDNEKTSIFIAFSSPYTEERMTILSFFRGVEQAEPEKKEEPKNVQPLYPEKAS